jgi:K+-sensing histidine kinase KdpD
VSKAYGALASVGAVVVVTGAIELLKAHVPVLSLGALYIFAVLPISIVWGLGFGVVVAVASMLAFNFFFLPPLYTFTLADSRNWFALAVFLVTAVVVSELAARSRRQARESALLARIATSLLEHGNVSSELERIAAETAEALRVEDARSVLSACGRRAARSGGSTWSGRNGGARACVGGSCRRWRRCWGWRSIASAWHVRRWRRRRCGEATR